VLDVVPFCELLPLFTLLLLFALLFLFVLVVVPFYVAIFLCACCYSFSCYYFFCAYYCSSFARCTKESKAFSMQTQTAFGASISKNPKDFKHPTTQDVLSSSRLVKCKLFSSSNVIRYHEKPMIILDKDFFVDSEHSSPSYVVICFPTQNSFVEGAYLELIYFNLPLLEIGNTSSV
jgi:hypothetical protein